MRLSAFYTMSRPAPALSVEPFQRMLLLLLPLVSILKTGTVGLAWKAWDGCHAIRQSRAYHVLGSLLEATAAAGRGGGGVGCGDGGNATVNGPVIPKPQLFGPDQQALGHEWVVQYCREAGSLGGVFLQQLIN